MNFKENIINTEIQEAKKITISSFLDKVSGYVSLDHALVELPSEYLEFFMKNEKTLKKSIDSLFEDYNPENPGYLGYSPEKKIVTKKIKYRGQLLIVQFDPEIGNWVPLPAFRSITQALKYGKNLIDEIK